MSKYRYCLMVILLIILSGCEVDPISTRNTDNPKLNIDVIGNYKEYEIIRFYDGGYNRYAVIRNNGSTVNSELSSGKTQRPDSVDSYFGDK